MTTVEAYRRKGVAGYVIVALMLVMIAVGLIAAFATQADKGIDGGMLIGYGIVLLIVIVPTIWLCRVAFRTWKSNREMEQAFRERGKLVEATVVGKDEREVGESTDHFVIYQYAPDFTVIAQDDSRGLQFWKKDIGEKISVKILPDKPMVSMLHLK